MRYRLKKKWPGGLEEGVLVIIEENKVGRYHCYDEQTDKVYKFRLNKELIKEYFEPVSERPMSWEEFANNGFLGYGINNNEKVKLYEDLSSFDISHRPTEEMAEAQLALSQLMQLRDARRDGWVRNISNKGYPVYVYGIKEQPIWSLSFKDNNMTNEFIKTFKDLIDKSLPLFVS